MKLFYKSMRRAPAEFVIVSVMLFMCAVPSHAHSGKGTIRVESAEMIEPLSVRYIVVLTFDADGHAAADAIATVVGEADGLRFGPIPMTPVNGGNDGRYTATVNLPTTGTWNVRFSSLDPTAVLERTERFLPQPTGLTSIVSPVTAATTVRDSALNGQVTSPNGDGTVPATSELVVPKASSRNSRLGGVSVGAVPAGLVVGAVGIALRRRNKARRCDA